MSVKSLRKKAILAFRRSDFDSAITLFSLAYEEQKSEEFLLFLELCYHAKNDPLGVSSLFELYADNISKNQSQNIISVLEIIEATNTKVREYVHNVNGISYADFMAIVENTGDFIKTFENIIHSSKIVIASRTELADFLENLIEHGFGDLAMNYLEDPNWALSFGYLAEKLRKKQESKKSDNQ